MFNVEEMIKEAYELQEKIRMQRKALKANEDNLKTLLEVLDLEKVTKAGPYERKPKIVSRRSIVPELFRARWPDLFDRLAKISLKDAEEEVRGEELNEVCNTIEIVSWKIIFHQWEV